MKLLVVGGAGFLGSHLVDRLLAEGNAVDVVDDLSTGSLANLAAARAVAHGALKFHHVDVRAPELVELLGRAAPDVVVHLALGAPAGPPRDLVERRIVGTVNLLDAAVAAAVDKVVVGVGGVELYGRVAPRDLPVKEGTLGPAEDLATVTTRTVVDLLSVYRDQQSLEHTTLAFGHVYGPRQRAADGVVAAFASAVAEGRASTISGDGRQTRDFVYVDDAVDALVRATTRGSGLVVNIGTGRQTSVRDLWSMMADLDAPAPVFAPPDVAEIGRFSLSPVRARIHLGWSAWTAVEDGVAQLLSA